MKTKFKVGQRVYSKSRGEYGKVVRVKDLKEVYPIHVDYKTSDNNPFTYTADGRFQEGSEIVLSITFEEKIKILLDI